MQAAAFACSVVGAVDRFLHIAAGLLQDFAHLARHVARVFFFIADQYFAGAKKDLSAFRRGRATPTVEGFFGGSYCLVDICCGGLRKATN